MGLHAVSTVGQAIETQTLTATGNIEFLNIPATYRHLRIEGYIRSAQANNEETFRIRFNNDSSTVSQGGYASTANVTFSAVNDVAGAYVLIGSVIGNSGGANRFSAVVIDIPNYADTVNFKSVTCSFHSAYSTTAASFRVGIGGGLWPVASAINRILLWTGSGAGQFLAGSTATLYGLGAA